MSTSPKRVDDLLVAEQEAVSEDSFHVNSYQELIDSIPEAEQETVLSQLDNSTIEQRALLLKNELSENKYIDTNISESYTLFLALLRNLRDNEISVNQLASLHILDSAIRTLYVNPVVYFIHKYVDADNELARIMNMFAVTNLKGMLGNTKRYLYNSIVLPEDGTNVSDMPWRMQKPLMRLATIAKIHPKNKLKVDSPAVDDILIDGELIYCYSPEVDTMFDPDYRPNYAQSFGDIFYVSSLSSSLHEDLKRAFIEDMVLNKELWKDQYGLGRADLRTNDQTLYNIIENQLARKTKIQLATTFSEARAMSELGLLSRNSDRTTDVPVSRGSLKIA